MNIMHISAAFSHSLLRTASWTTA